MPILSRNQSVICPDEKQGVWESAEVEFDQTKKKCVVPICTKMPGFERFYLIPLHLRDLVAKPCSEALRTAQKRGFVELFGD